jgi:hypothetical protein
MTISRTRPVFLGCAWIPAARPFSPDCPNRLPGDRDQFAAWPLFVGERLARSTGGFRKSGFVLRILLSRIMFDAKALMTSLSGYPEHMAEIRYRLVPFIC